MKAGSLQFLAILAAQCLLARGESQNHRILGAGDEKEFSNTQAKPEITDVVNSVSAKFAADLFGQGWSARDMDYIGGDEFVQMYDDKVETRIMLRGYMDNDVDTVSVRSHILGNFDSCVNSPLISFVLY
jgi:hypothetical protein